MNAILKKVFLLLIFCSLSHPVLAEDLNGIKHKKTTSTTTIIITTTIPITSSLNEPDILKESQRCFDRSLDILNAVLTAMGVLVALLIMILSTAAVLAYSRYRDWKKIVDNAKKYVDEIKEMRDKAEKHFNETRISQPEDLSLTEKPSEENRKTLDEFGKRLDLIEMLGVSLKPGDYTSRGNDFFYKSEYEKALKAYDKAIELDPNYAMAWFNKGTALGKLSRHEKALKAYDKAIELDPNYAMAWFNKGTALGKLSRHEKSLKAFDKAIELGPNYAMAWCNKGAALGKLSRHEDAMKAFDKAIELDPNYAMTWVNKGNALIKLSRHEDALKACDKAIELDPNFGGAWYNRACSHSLLGKKGEALSDLKRAIELDKLFKSEAKTDLDFKNLWEDDDFKKIVE